MRPQPNQAVAWTDDEIALLKRLWKLGYSARLIAREIKGATRNSVIGKAHRLHLPVRVTKFAAPNHPPPRSPATIKRAA